MPTNHTQEKIIKATQTAFDIIEAVAELDQPTVSKIAEEVDYSRSTVHYHLKTLQKERYVIADNGGFRLGLRMARLGNLSIRDHRLTEVVEEPADDLAAATGATAHVAVEEDGALVWFYRSPPDGSDDPPTAVGLEAPIHCTAYGQAILAHMSPEEVSELVESHGLSPVTSETLTDPGALRERLDTVQDLGFAYSAREYSDGFSSIAAPIVDTEDSIVGSIGIMASYDWIDDPYKHAKARRFSDELPGLVRKAAQSASDRLLER